MWWLVFHCFKLVACVSKSHTHTHTYRWENWFARESNKKWFKCLIWSFVCVFGSFGKNQSAGPRESKTTNKCFVLLSMFRFISRLVDDNQNNVISQIPFAIAGEAWKVFETKKFIQRVCNRSLVCKAHLSFISLCGDFSCDQFSSVRAFRLLSTWYRPMCAMEKLVPSCQVNEMLWILFRLKIESIRKEKE